MMQHQSRQCGAIYLQKKFAGVFGLFRFYKRYSFFLILFLLAGCGNENIPGNKFSEPSYSGTTQQGERLIHEYGCGSCHVIPGISSATGRVGPPLQSMSKRAYVGGIIPNTYDELVRWLLNPQLINPDSAMPDVGLNITEAEAVAAYLYTL